jgi:hypothetical protein
MVCRTVTTICAKLFCSANRGPIKRVQNPCVLPRGVVGNGYTCYRNAAFDRAKFKEFAFSNSGHEWSFTSAKNTILWQSVVPVNRSRLRYAWDSARAVEEKRVELSKSKRCPNAAWREVNTIGGQIPQLFLAARNATFQDVFRYVIAS